MRGVKPNHEMWHRMNVAALNGQESVSAAELLVTLIDACSSILRHAGFATDAEARAHLAAMILSPDNAPRPGSLLPLLKAELDKLDDGRWIQ